MEKGTITAKQQEILDFMKSTILTKGYPPSVRDICSAVNLKSTSSVHAHLETLEKRGYIKRDPAKNRAIEIIDDSFQMVRQEMTSIPIVGNVAAGEPLFAEQNIDGYFPLPVEYVPNNETFVLKVRGDSMINVGIFSGDQIFVQSCNTARNGDIVVALIDDNATVKSTEYKEDGIYITARLRNRDYNKYENYIRVGHTATQDSEGNYVCTDLENFPTPSVLSRTLHDVDKDAFTDLEGYTQRNRVRHDVEDLQLSYSILSDNDEAYILNRISPEWFYVELTDKKTKQTARGQFVLSKGVLGLEIHAVRGDGTFGASERIRTSSLLIRSQALYPLSYWRISCRP